MIEHTDLSIPVYERLKEMILKNKLKPGEKLLQEKLAVEMGVSRTPLLKAMQMLEYDFLVESIPRRGMFVKQLSVHEMMDIYDVREGIEAVAVRLLCERINKTQLAVLKEIWKPFKGVNKINTSEYQHADDRFHALLLEFSGNKILKKIYNHSFIQARIVQMGIMRSPEETLPEHLALVDAIEKGDAGKAGEVLKMHLNKSKALIENNFMNKESRNQ